MQNANKPLGLGNSIAAATIVVAVFALSNAATPLYVRWQADWGFSSGTLTVVFAAYIAGLIFALLFAGRIADQRGRRVVLLPGLALAVISSLLFLSAHGALWLLVARLLAGASVGATVTAGMAAVVDLAPEQHKRTGSLFASAAMVLGAGLGPLLSGLIARVTGEAQGIVFGILALTSAAAFITAWRLPLPRPVPQASSRWSFPVPPRERRREVAWGIATFAPGITATSFVLSLGPSVLSDQLGTSDALLAGATACAMFLAATGIQFALGRLSPRSHLLISSLAVVASMVLLAATMTLWASPALFVVSALLAGVAQGLGQFAGLTLIAINVPARRRAESNAALNIAAYVPAAALPIATGFLSDAVGLPLAVLAFTLVLGTTGIIAATTVRLSSRNLSNENHEFPAEKVPSKETKA
ncbi:MFS transporter [Glutamicibacter halophytocola]|uniref:MFS transporter n=1 Tax=Glutamicibacter halophytocola TaxID=1933880 RepID=A0ABX5YDD2_9MICC|nr:MFS transporter [Glutamicibacter halophytocola]QDY67664.1 MFS transporter [Glutamicibacter halophytocola]